MQETPSTEHNELIEALRPSEEMFCRIAAKHEACFLIKKIDIAIALHNEGGSLTNKLVGSSETLGLIDRLNSMGISLPTKRPTNRTEPSDWTQNPRYRTTKYLRKVQEVLHEYAHLPDKIQQALKQFLEEENIPPSQILEYDLIQSDLNRHFEAVFEIYQKHPFVDLPEDETLQKIHQKKRSETKAGPLERIVWIKQHLITRVQDIGVLICDRIL